MARPSLKSQPLLEISVVIPPEAEEAVAVALEAELGQIPSFYVDERTRRVTAKVYLAQKDWTAPVQKKVNARLADLRSFGFKLGKVASKKLPPENWAESWKKHFKPITIGRALLIKPSWSKLKPLKGQQVVILDPGLSFGTGQHATTSFCLQQIVKYRQTEQSQSFLDIGTGSGILAIAAAKLGYSPVAAFDFDPESVRVSVENAEINGVQKAVQPEQKDLTRLPVRPKTQYDLVCANLIFDLLIQEAARITNRVKPGGALVLAGILKSQFPAVQKAFKEQGFSLSRTKKEKEWQSGFFTSLR